MEERKAGSVINICSYNTRTLRVEEDLEHLSEKMDKFNLDIIGTVFQKLKEREGTMKLKDGS